MENFEPTNQPVSPTPTGPKRIGAAAWLGIVVIAIGLLMLGRNTGLFNPVITRIVFSWEMFLIALGCIQLLYYRSQRSGLILIGIGIFFLLVNFYHMPFSTWQIFVPAILIVIGIQMIFGFGRMRGAVPHFFDSTKLSSDSFFEIISVFGGGHRVIVTPEFKGGKAISVFGGSEIDLRRADIPSGTEAVIETVSIFGGTEMHVPDEWNVRMEVLNIFGGFSDKRIAAKVDSSKVLIIRGLALFGGGEIKSF